jgi:hypothetical protein
MTYGIAINALGLGGLLALVLWWARRSTEAVRLRNALRLQESRAEDFTWKPPDFPAGFAVERGPPDPQFRSVVDSLGIDSLRGDWSKALALAGHLTERAQDKGPVQSDPLTTYRAIRDGHGYCADFVKVFLVLASAAGLVTRQWAFSFDGFGGHGHAVVEVFDRQRGRWLFLDVFNNFHVVDETTGEPLGALEYRNVLLERRGPARMERNGPGRAGFVHAHQALDYYRRGVDQWYLVWGNAVQSYYSHPAVQWSGRASRWLAHLVANLVGAQPHIRIYATPENRELVERMFALRRRLKWLGLFALVLFAVLVAQVVTAGRALALIL